jgi:hypothetical protein
MTRRLFLFSFIFSVLISFSQEKIKPTTAYNFLSAYQNVRDIAISKDEKEIYFTIQSPDEQVSKIAYVTKEKNKWSNVKLASFSSAHRDIEPFLSSDGLRLYYASNQPLNDSISESKDYDIWYVERKNTKSDWSKPIRLGNNVNSDKDEFYPSIADNGNLYFTSENNQSLGKDDIFVCKWNNNDYSKPENLGVTINSDGYEFNAFIAPNEAFLIYTCYKREDGFGSGDMYISCRNEKKEWEKAKNLGSEVNSTMMDYCPFYDSKNKILYFTSKRNAVTNKRFNSFDEFQKEINKNENGFSRIYKYNISL